MSVSINIHGVSSISAAPVHYEGGSWINLEIISRGNEVFRSCAFFESATLADAYAEAINGVTERFAKPAPVEATLVEGATCENCRFWSQDIVAQPIGCEPIKALCLEPLNSRIMVPGNFKCSGWKIDSHGAVDEPSDYGETARATYEAEEDA